MQRGTPSFRRVHAHGGIPVNDHLRTLLYPTAAAAMALGCLGGCSTPSEGSLEAFSRWHDSAHRHAENGALQWSDFYQQSFDRLSALTPSLQQDARLEKTTLLLSHARKYEARELTPQQFNAERQVIETQLAARMH